MIHNLKVMQKLAHCRNNTTKGMASHLHNKRVSEEVVATHSGVHNNCS